VLGLPQERFESVHVVGTNGKSSTARFTAAILERHGRRTGSYTSPHLRSFRERIEVGETPVSEGDFAAAVEQAAHAAALVDRTADPEDQVTQFEALTAAAYWELARREVDAAVVEAGLGGRYDATSVIRSRVQVLTGVGLEHTRWLGPRIEDIAEEKLAVVQEGATLVTPPDLPPAARAVAERVTRERGARLVKAGPALAAGVQLRAAGGFQRANFALAAAAAEAFLDHALDPAAVKAAARETRVPGRMDVVGQNPLTVYDGAHNPSGAEALAGSLAAVLGERYPRVAVIGVLEDKDAAEMLRALLPHFERVVFTRSGNPRALPPATLVSLAEKLAPAVPAQAVGDPRAAVDRARVLAGPGGAVIVTGSIYLIADLLRESRDARASTL
jgi:dihydrofolate synthase/folylpolyglutamate synthase